MPKSLLVPATFEIFLRQADQTSDHTASSAVGFQGCSKQGLSVAGLYLFFKYTWAFKVQNTGHTIWLQYNRNKIMHAYNGNVVIRLHWDQDQLIDRRVLSLDNIIDDTPQHQLSISKLLQLRKQYASEPLIQTSLVSQLPAHQTTPQVDPPQKPYTRSGRRRKVVTAEGPKFYKQNKQVSPRDTGIKRIKRIQTTKVSHTPPPRGTPGATLADEECSPTGEGVPQQSRGAIRRRARRRLFRLWRRLAVNSQVNGAGSRSLPLLPPKKATPNRAKWFRQTMLRQHTYVRNKKSRITASPTTPPMPYSAKLRIGSLNVQGFADALKLKNSIQIMEEHRLDVLILTETKSTSYYSYISEGHVVILSGNKKDKYAGVGAILSPKIRPYLMDVLQVSNRIIHLGFRKQGGNVHVIGAYAPHAGRDFEVDRQPFWDQLEEHVSRIPQPEPVYLTGDMNVRFQGRHKNDEGVLGPFVYGKGRQHIDHTASSNRSLCIKAMRSFSMVEAASFLTPNMVNQITYRDKAAPPTSWSQFILDPLILQQFYSTWQNIDPPASLTVCSVIRSFLTDEAPLPPERLDPHPDPVRFQRLDHFFTRSQWLSSVNSRRSKLHTGFPTDHYLLVTEVQIKLAKRSRRPPTIRRYDLSSLDIATRFSYNEVLKSSLGLQTSSPLPPEDHTAVGQFYTDGSGSKGRCTSSTPAGWGWCLRKGDDWIDACGPVVTSPDHTAYLGANVGSNNTGELTAIAEAALYSLEHNVTTSHIHSDSQWAINVITGKWRPKTHHNLINNIRALLSTPLFQFHLHWVRSHVRNEGNEGADKLANEGRASVTSKGGRQHAKPQPTHTAAPCTFSNLIPVMDHALKQTFQLEHAPNRRPMDHTGNNQCPQRGPRS